MLPAQPVARVLCVRMVMAPLHHIDRRRLLVEPLAHQHPNKP